MTFSLPDLFCFSSGSSLKVEAELISRAPFNVSLSLCLHLEYFENCGRRRDSTSFNMDPVSIIGILGTTVGLVRTCTQISQGLGNLAGKVQRHQYDLDSNRPRDSNPRHCCDPNPALGGRNLPPVTIDTETALTPSKPCACRFRGLVGTARGGSGLDAEQSQAIGNTSSPGEAQIYME